MCAFSNENQFRKKLFRISAVQGELGKNSQIHRIRFIFAVSLPFQWTVRTSHRARVQEQFAVFLECVELVRMAGDQDVHVQLTLHQLERILVVPRHNLMTVTQAYSELANGDHLLVRIIGRRLDDEHFVRIQVIEENRNRKFRQVDRCSYGQPNDL